MLGRVRGIKAEITAPLVQEERAGLEGGPGVRIVEVFEGYEVAQESGQVAIVVDEPMHVADAGGLRGEGTPREWAVEMVRLPAHRMLARLLERGEIDNELLDVLARLLVEFHAGAMTVQFHGREDDDGALLVGQRRHAALE